MESNGNDEQTYYFIRNTQPDTVLDNAKRFYYLRKTCFRGMMRYNKQGKFNVAYGRYKTICYDNLLNPQYENTLFLIIMQKF